MLQRAHTRERESFGDRPDPLALELCAERVRQRTDDSKGEGSERRSETVDEEESVVIGMGRVTSEMHEGLSCVPKDVQYALKEATTKSNVMGGIAVMRSN